MESIDINDRFQVVTASPSSSIDPRPAIGRRRAAVNDPDGQVAGRPVVQVQGFTAEVAEAAEGNAEGIEKQGFVTREADRKERETTFRAARDMSRSQRGAVNSRIAAVFSIALFPGVVAHRQRR